MGSQRLKKVQAIHALSVESISLPRTSECIAEQGVGSGPRNALQVQRQTEEENAAAEAEQLHLQEEEWNMADLERIQEQQVIAFALLVQHLTVSSMLFCLVLLVCSQRTWI